MNEIELKHSIESSIRAFLSGSISQNALNLFAKLGYKTDRQNPFIEKTYRFFKESFLEPDTSFNETKAMVDDWKSIDLLFQLTQEELSDQRTIFDTKKVNNTIIETYLFFAIELNKTDYSRSALAQITREINKIFPMPVMLLFKYGDYLTLSVINRRLNKKDEQKDVLEKVTLIKDISIQNPHRAHIEILFDLSFEELKRLHKFTNFVELHNAWQKTLDTKELNKRFYRELSNWYFWAINHVSFPNDIDNDKDDTDFNSESIIRLLTRLIFIWFIKEKNLIPEKIFAEKEVSKLINGFKIKGSKVYYRAILQNLFFATLNQKIEKRAFVTDGTFQQNKKNYGIKNLYRYSSDFIISKDEVIKLFERVPFLNGGLFDCLDSEDKNGKVMYLDGFSRNLKKQAQVPDELFFSQEKIIDLSDVYDDKKKKNEKVKGLFDIFNHYKFTVTENTPIEEEVALDPELLGRVFENLLASYNPETKATARKETGSFYTPREIVNYMVDESLKAYLELKLETEAVMKPEDAEIGLEFLLGYNERDNLFNEKETLILIEAIDNCKILDPACGSGAFPMGILHKLVFILQKLDPKNENWRKIQTDKAIRETENAYKIGNKQEREDRLIEISNTFDENTNDLNYARKLFLIENCIYGVDIQPIATQISKLRFFISLIVDQKADKNKVNFGICPLPNLETKFVTANTLIGIDKSKAQGSLFDNQKVKELEEKLKDVRHRLFVAKTSASKRKLQEEDQKLREEMGKTLESSGWRNESARQLAAWDPYNQNASSPFLDPEWMFGVTNGFDVVIGNPPYGFRDVLTPKEKVYFRKVENIEFSSGDSAELFCKKCFDKLVKNNGILTFIIPKKSLYGDAWEGYRKDYWIKYNLKYLIDSSKAFENVLLEMNFFGLEKNFKNGLVKCGYLKKDNTINEFGISEKSKIFLKNNTAQIYKLSIPESLWEVIQVLKSSKALVMGKLGLAIGTDFYSDEQTDYKLLKGIDITRWKIKQNRWLKNKLKLNWNNAKEFQRSKVICQRLVAHIENPNPHIKITACYDEEGIIITNTIMSFKLDEKLSPKFWLAYLNSTFASWFAYNFIYARAIRSMDFYNFYIQQLPIPKLIIERPETQQPIITLVDKILAITKFNDYLQNPDKQAKVKEYEKQIDQMVYSLYNLTREEIAIIEGT